MLDGVKVVTFGVSKHTRGRFYMHGVNKTSGGTCDAKEKHLGTHLTLLLQAIISRLLPPVKMDARQIDLSCAPGNARQIPAFPYLSDACLIGFVFPLCPGVGEAN